MRTPLPDGICADVVSTSSINPSGLDSRPLKLSVQYLPLASIDEVVQEDDLDPFLDLLELHVVGDESARPGLQRCC